MSAHRGEAVDWQEYAKPKWPGGFARFFVGNGCCFTCVFPILFASLPSSPNHAVNSGKFGSC